MATDLEHGAMIAHGGARAPGLLVAAGG